METGPWVCSASSLAMWAETKQPALLLVKVTLGPLIWAIKGAMNPPPPPCPPPPPAASEVPGWKTLDTVFPV